MIDQIIGSTEIFSTQNLIIILSGILLTVASFIGSPVVLRYVFRYISTENVDFNQKRFIGNARWAISSTFLASSVIIISRQQEIFMSLGGLIGSALLTILVFLWIRVIHNLGQYAIKRIVTIRYDKSIIPIIGNVWTFMVIVGGIFVSFDVWNIDITPLLASAGIAGVVLGLAARETISNFFGSIALYADDAYQTGDFIKLQDGSVEGYVDDISIRSTQLVTLSGNKVIVPNSKLHNSIIENKSSPDNQYRTIIKVGVSYESDQDLAERSIRTAVENVIESEESYRKSWFFGGKDNYKIFVDEFEDSAVVFKIFAKVSRPEDEPRIRSNLHKSIRDELNKQGIKIPYPQRSIHFDSDTVPEGWTTEESEPE